MKILTEIFNDILLILFFGVMAFIVQFISDELSEKEQKRRSDKKRYAVFWAVLVIFMLTSLVYLSKNKIALPYLLTPITAT